MSEDDTTAHSSKRRPFLKAGAGAVAVSLAGCTGDDSEGTPTEGTVEPATDSTPDTVDEGEEITEGGDFRYGMSNAPAGLNALSTSSSYSWVILDQIHAYGTSIDPVTFEVHPNLFTDWTVENVDSGEPDVYFNVRDGLTFNDGEDFGIDDVIFTYNFLKEAQPGRYANNISPVETVEEASNDWDVHMKLSKPVGTYDTTQLGLPMLPKHVWSDVDPAEFSQYKPTETTYEVDGTEYSGPVGLGAGRITRYEPDTSVEVTYRDDYTLNDLQWLEDHDNLRAGGPFIDTLRVNVYGSSEALQQAFLQEDAIDAMYGSIQPSNIPKVEDKEGARIVTGSDTGYSHYSFNMRRTPLDDTIFRQTMGFLFDHIRWTDQLNRETELRGAFVMPPGYEAVRPETAVDGAEINEHPATKAFDFLQDQPGVPNFSAIKAYLKNGEPIHGEEGSYADGEREYPGSLTGASADETEARHEYTWGSVESDVLQDQPGVEEEIRVNGKTITEILGRPLEMMMYPPQDSPLSAQMVENFVGQLRSLGIPVERNVLTFNTMLNEVYRDVNFDIFPMGWTSLSPFAVSTLDSLFTSDNAHGPDSEHESLLNNPMGYGLEGVPGADDLIKDALSTMDTEERNSKARQAVEKIYLDYPTQVNSHAIPQWPVNEAKWKGYVEGIPSPGDSYVAWQFQNVHLKE
ncbi:ABC transporter substrate-binding protein [Haloparvum sp. PAK95]|uniref:ABC transporter substrate-binding protein n=1 Tax=Haloparvum sp. PAK95 TaxID=3418962 RepID=UPI003D2EFB24